MRILVVANFQIEYSIQLANAMARLCEVSLVLWDQMAPDRRGQVEENVKVIEFRVPGIISWSRAYTQARVAQFASQSNADIVHFQNAYAWNSLYPRSYRKKVQVLTVHDPYPHLGHLDPWSFPAIAVHGFHARAIIVLGNAQKSSLLTRFRLPAWKVHVIPHGDFSYLSGSADPPPSNGSTVLFFGRIAAYKGIEDFLRACVYVKENHETARFRVVGQGDLTPYRGLMSTLTDLEVRNTFVSREELAREIENSALLVAPYVEASQSGVAIAAQSLGRPVVGTRVGGLPEDILDGRTGLLVEPRNWRALGDAILQLLSDSERRKKMGANAFNWMRTERSWAKIASKTVALYEAVS